MVWGSSQAVCAQQPANGHGFFLGFAQFPPAMVSTVKVIYY